MESIYANNNKHGFRLNINHPYINKLYLRFKASKGVGVNSPLNDSDRREFETIIIEKLKKKGLLPAEGVVSSGGS